MLLDDLGVPHGTFKSFSGVLNMSNSFQKWSFTILKPGCVLIRPQHLRPLGFTSIHSITPRRFLCALRLSPKLLANYWQSIYSTRQACLFRLNHLQLLRHLDCHLGQWNWGWWVADSTGKPRGFIVSICDKLILYTYIYTIIYIINWVSYHVCPETNSGFEGSERSKVRSWKTVEVGYHNNVLFGNTMQYKGTRSVQAFPVFFILKWVPARSHTEILFAHVCPMSWHTPSTCASKTSLFA